MHVFGLTGGIGTGKSAVAADWKRLGLPVIDADQLSRKVVAPESPGLSALVRQFGAEILTDDGGLARDLLAEKVFSDADARARLERIIHPLVRDAAKTRISELAKHGEPLACYEVPLLFEVGLQEELRPVVVVGVNQPTQLERLMRRDGIVAEQAERRIAAQLPLERKLAMGDYRIDNSGTPEQRTTQSRSVLRALCERLSVPARRYEL